MEFDRRTFLATGAAAVLGRPSFRTLLQQQAVLDWRPLRGGAVVALGAGGNSIHVRAGAGGLLVDTKLLGFGAALRREALERGPVTHVVNTHHHFDHVGGNPEMGGVPLVAHRAAGPRVQAGMTGAVADLQRQGTAWFDSMLGRIRQWTTVRETPELRRDAEALVADAARLTADRFVPTELVGDRHDVRFGSGLAELRHIAPAHTDNDMFVYLPAENILHGGDLLFHRYHAVTDVSAGANSQGWRQTLDAMYARCNAETLVVPGHGEIGGREIIQAQRQYWDRIEAVVTAAVREGRTRDEVRQLPLPEYEGFAFPQNRATNLGIMYDELARR